MTTVSELVAQRSESLEHAGSPTPRLDAELLIGHALGLSRTRLYADGRRELDEREVAAADRLIDRRIGREPVAYILGHWGFRRLDLAVDRRVLIPRPETEELVDICLALLAPLPEPTVLDVGTGSGAIALAIAQELADAWVTAVDVSPDALELARRNGDAAGLVVEWVESDLLAELGGRRFDLIVSNPPYISDAELETLEPGVRDFEPRLALAAGDGLEVIRRVVQDAPAALRPGGRLALECGMGQAPAVADALRAAGFDDIEVRLDFAGVERFVTGRLA